MNFTEPQIQPRLSTFSAPISTGGFKSEVLKISVDPRIVGPALQRLGSDLAEHLLNKAHFKRLGDGVRFDWHPDICRCDRGLGTWVDVNGTGNYVQTVLCVDDMTTENDPLMFVKGSSRWGKVNFAHPGQRSGRILSLHHT